MNLPRWKELAADPKSRASRCARARASGITFAIALLAALFPAPAARAAGTLENHQFFSNALGQDKWVQVYLPDGYDPGSPQQYPLIVFLHGAVGDDHTSYGATLIPALNNLIAAGTIRPVIVVKPDGGGCGPWNFYTGCNWVNSETLGNYEDYVVQDVVAWTESNYKILPGSASRAIMGHSMGAFGAMHAALANPGAFAAVAAHSGYQYFQDLVDVHLPLVLAENSGPPYTWTPSDFLTGGWFMLSAGFSPNPLNPPYDLDFPLDSAGLLIPSVFDRWLEHDPAALASALPPGTAPAIYFDCGTADDFSLHPFNVHFDQHLTSLGIAHDWRSYNGTHANRLAFRFPIALRFLDGVLANPTAVNGIAPAEEGGLGFAHAPNPVRSGVRISFELPASQRVSIDVFDVTGRHRATLLDEVASVGAHEVTWDAEGVPAGIYFYRLTSAERRETRRMVVAH